MSGVDNKELDRMLQQAFDASTKIYQERGFQRRIGFGKRPAVISVDLANAWTRPGNPFTCDQDAMDNAIILGMQRLLISWPCWDRQRKTSRALYKADCNYNIP